MNDEIEIDEIKKKVFRHPDSTDLYMRRVQIEVVKEFKDIANKEFLGDYGFCLKWLLEGFKKGDPQVYALLDNHESRISDLEQGKVNQPEKKGKTIKMLNGKEKKA